MNKEEAYKKDSRSGAVLGVMTAIIIILMSILLIVFIPEGLWSNVLFRHSLLLLALGFIFPELISRPIAKYIYGDKE